MAGHSELSLQLRECLFFEIRGSREFVMLQSDMS